MFCTTRRQRSKNYYPHFGNIIDGFFNIPMVQTAKTSQRDLQTPAVNVTENDDGFIIDLAVPGHTKKDITISVDSEILTVKSNKVVETNGVDYRLREFDYAGFEKRFVLPETIDQSKVDANFTNGILKISLDKKEEAKPQPTKTITIN